MWALLLVATTRLFRVEIIQKEDDMGKTYEWFVRIFGGNTEVISQDQIPRHRLPRRRRNYEDVDKLPPEPYKRSGGWFKNLIFPGEHSDDVRRRFDE